MKTSSLFLLIFDELFKMLCILSTLTSRSLKGMNVGGWFVTNRDRIVREVAPSPSQTVQKRPSVLFSSLCEAILPPRDTTRLALLSLSLMSHYCFAVSCFPAALASTPPFVFPVLDPCPTSDLHTITVPPNSAPCSILLLKKRERKTDADFS